MVHAPILQAAVLAIINRFLLVVDVLTGMYRTPAGHAAAMDGIQ